MATRKPFVGIVAKILAYVDEETGSKALRFFTEAGTQEEDAYVRFGDTIVQFGEHKDKTWEAAELARLGKILSCEPTFAAVAENLPKLEGAKTEIVYGERDDKSNPGVKLETKRIYFTDFEEKPASQAVALSDWAK